MATLIAITAVVSRGAHVAPGQTFTEVDPAEVAWLVREGAATVVPDAAPAAEEPTVVPDAAPAAEEPTVVPDAAPAAEEPTEVLVPRIPVAKSKR